jgi:hypothetical protein
MSERACSRCRQVKSLDEFPPQHQPTAAWCLECWSEVGSPQPMGDEHVEAAQAAMKEDRERG